MMWIRVSCIITAIFILLFNYLLKKRIVTKTYFIIIGIKGYSVLGIFPRYRWAFCSGSNGGDKSLQLLSSANCPLDALMNNEAV